jgi:hypothetical protein
VPTNRSGAVAADPDEGLRPLPPTGSAGKSAEESKNAVSAEGAKEGDWIWRCGVFPDAGRSSDEDPAKSDS